MLIRDLRKVGNRMLAGRKRLGLTQAEVAEAANIADRTYADIERGSVNMRIETFIRICEVLRLSPNDMLVDDETARPLRMEDLLEKLHTCGQGERETALRLLQVYLDSI